MTVADFKHPAEIESWSLYANQAFSAPLRFDVAALLSRAHAQLNAIKDHLWSLQTNPSYTRRYMRTINQGEVHKLFNKDTNGLGLVGSLYYNVLEHIQWQWVIAALEKVEAAQRRFRDNIFPGQRLPPSFDRALGELELTLVNLARRAVFFLGGTYFERPGFQARYTSTYDQAARRGIARLKVPLTKQQVFKSDPLEWVVHQMTGYPDDMNSYENAFLSSFLEEHFRSSPPAERARVDEILYHQITDLAASQELLASVRTHRPQNRAADTRELSETECPWKNTIELFAVDFQGQSPIWKRLPSMLMNDFYRADWPSGAKNAAWLERSQELHRGLNAFWAEMKAAVAHTLKSSLALSPDVIEATLKVITASSSPEYCRAIEAETDKILAGIAKTSSTSHAEASQDWKLDAPANIPLRPAESLKRYVLHVIVLMELPIPIRLLLPLSFLIPRREISYHFP